MAERPPTKAAAVSDGAPDVLPPPFVVGPVRHVHFDGTSDDLLTGGLGHEGIQSENPPGFRVPLRPTPAELRRRVIYESYKALMDRTAGGGFGTLFGPAMVDGRVSGDGKIAGDEYTTYAEATGGRPGDVVTMMVQVPATFDVSAPVIIAAPSSGSRGVFGAIATVGEWALKRGFAVCYTDKGTGNGAHDLDRNRVYGSDGTLVDAEAAGADSQFTAKLTAAECAQFLGEDRRHRFAFKHAHSQRNPQQHWGTDVLRAIEFAFHILNRHFQRIGDGMFTPANTLVIASGISNGGVASLRAGEQDEKGLIHGIVVSEPAVQPVEDAASAFVIIQGNGEPVRHHGRPLLDYITFLDVYLSCALADADVQAVTPPVSLSNPKLTSACPARCRALHRLGLLESADERQQPAEAQRRIIDYGMLEEQVPLQSYHHFLGIFEAVAVTYANTYGRFSVADHLAGFSFAAVDRTLRPAPLAEEIAAEMYATSTGIAPTPANPPLAGVLVINNDAPGGSMLSRVSTPDQNLEGALRLRRLATGVHEQAHLGKTLTPEEQDQHRRIAQGIDEVRATADLGGRPAIIVHGRADALLPVNHTSRPYYARNQVIEGPGSRLRYYEVTHAHHFDAFNSLPGFAERYVPLHHYLVQGLAIMVNHLRYGAPLPPSQVVRTRPRGIGPQGGPAPITAANLPPISFDPATDARIRFDGAALRIPE
jgi:hydroxybutyrate-dimer hydrolase